MAGNDSNCNHIVLFPFMSKGHTIPLLHLARRLLRSPLVTAVTVVTTPANRPFIASSLSGTAASVVSIPFPHGIPDIGPSIESTDQLPSMSLFPAFASSTTLMQPQFEAELEKLLPVKLLVSDGFLWWTLESANKFGIPRMVFYGMSNYAFSMSRALAEMRPPAAASNGPFTVAAFLWIKITRNDLDSLPYRQSSDAVHLEFMKNTTESTSNSYGLLVNSFLEMEPAFHEYWNREVQPRAWCVGPLCLVDQPEPISDNFDKPTWSQWLDRKRDEGAPVLYVAFGSQAEISAQQLKEIAEGLERSEAHFLWVTKKESDLGDGFEERVKNRGLVVRDWVDQISILMHPSLQGFLSHCGWNSVIESICAGVPILAWPMMADQPLNAKMVEEELGIGLRVNGLPFKGGVGLVRCDEVERTVRELMEGERGKEARRKARDLAEAARRAVEDGGSSWRTLNSLLKETCSTH